MDAPSFTPGMNKQHNTSCTSLENFDQETYSFTARRTPQEETLGAASFNHNLTSNKQAFLKVEQESKKKLANELQMREAKIKQLEEELAKKEQSKQSIKKIEMASWQKDFLPHCFGNFEDCRVTFDGNFAIVEGKPESVGEQQLKLLKELAKLKEQPPEISPIMHSSVCKKDGQQYLLNLNTTHSNGVRVFLHDKSLLVVTTFFLALKDAIDFLNDKLIYKETSISEAEILIEKLQFIKLSLEDKFLVNISWDIKKREIYVEGIKDHVFESIREIRTLMLEHLETSSFTAGRRPREEILGAASFNQNLIANKHTFQKVEQESKKKLASELEMRDAKIKQLEEELAKKTEQSKQSIERIKMTSWQKDFLPHCFGNFEGCRIHYDGSFAILEGKPESVKEQQLKLLKELAKLTEQPLEVTPTMHSILSKNDGHQYLLNLNTTHLNGVKVFLHDQSLLVVATSDLALKDAMGILTNKLNYKETISEAEIPTEKLQFQKMSLEFKFLVNISWDIKKKEIYVEGIKDDVIESIREIRTLMLEHMDQEKSFAVRGLHAKLLHNFYEDQIKQCLQTVQTIDYLSTEADIVIQFKGDRKVVQQVHRKLTELETKVIVKSWNVKSEFKKPEELMLIAKGFVSDEMKKKINNFEASNKCIVSHKLPSWKQFKIRISKKVQAAHSGQSDDEEFVVEVLQQDVNNSYNPEISIMVLHGGAIENMWSDLKQTIIKVCLHTQYFNQDIVNYWPKNSWDRILQKAKKLCVWVERSPNPKTQKPGFIIKGEKEPVKKVYKTINEEFNDISSHLPKNRIKSSKAPLRGTSEFLKHAAESDEVFPSYWKLNGLNPDTNSLGGGFLKRLSGDLYSYKPENHLVNIDSETKEAIKKLVKKTWEPNYVGHGNDAAGLSHHNIKVLDVKRIENKHLFESYSAQRKLLFRKMSLKNHICIDIKKIPGSKGRIVTTEILEDFMKEELYYEVNEHYLFHGTKTPDAIVANGIDPRVYSEGGMFGRGIYTAEKFIKSDQYTDSRSHRTATGTTLYMILASVLLGNVFLCDHNHPSVASKGARKLTRPPCMHCSKDICTCANQELFDSVMGDGKWIFREFVVYDRYQCYPEYLISYQREA